MRWTKVFTRLAGCGGVQWNEKGPTTSIAFATNLFRRHMWLCMRRRDTLLTMSDVTHILNKIEAGDQQASEDLLPLVYAELRKLASGRMASQPADHTLQATALVHEAYVRLVDKDKVQKWDSRGHFFSAAALAMRRILIDHARRKAGAKHGGQHKRQPLAMDVEFILPLPSDELLAVNEALTEFESEDPQIAKIVELRFFAGLSMPQIAEALGRSLRSVERDWRYARSWLHRAVSQGDASSI